LLLEQNKGIPVATLSNNKNRIINGKPNACGQKLLGG